MNSKVIGASLLRLVVEGSSLHDAAASLGIKMGHARSGFDALCEALDLPLGVRAVRANPTIYMEALAAYEGSSNFSLRKALIRRLLEIFRLKSAFDLTPNIVSSLTASELLGYELDVPQVAEIQEWLQDNGLSLRRHLPAVEQDFHTARAAILMLRAFAFDTHTVEIQLEALEHKWAVRNGEILVPGS